MHLPGFLDIAGTLLSENALSMLFPAGTVFSFPAVVAGSGGQMDAMFLHPAAREGTLHAGRPFAWLLLDSKTGEVMLLGNCSVTDFADSDRFPPDMAVDMRLPGEMADRDYTESYKELLEVYDLLRLFAFQTDLATWQQEAKDWYRELFFTLAPVGHYPFYKALAPDFFAWLDMDLGGEEAPAPPPEPLFHGTEPPHNNPVLAEIQALREALEAKGAAELRREALFDQMHRELVAFRGGLADKINATMENDVIKVIDDVEKTVGAWRGKNATKENFRRLVRMLEGFETDLCDLLYRQGLEPFRVEGDEVDVHRQKILAVTPCADPELDKRVARRHARGWEKNGRVVRPERVTAYVYNPAQDGGETEENG